MKKSQKKKRDYMIVTLCGSTRFKEEFEIIAKELSLLGHLVLSPYCFGHCDNDPRIEKRKELLDLIHLRKIDLSDAIFVVTGYGYVGESTQKEIEYAAERKKQILWQSANLNMSLSDWRKRIFKEK